MKDWNELMDERGDPRHEPMKPQVVGARARTSCLARRRHHRRDCGTVTTWAARYLRDPRRHDVLRAPGSLATMANGLPYAIAAAVAYPGRQVVGAVRRRRASRC